MVSSPVERVLRPEVKSFIPLVSVLLFAVRACAPVFNSSTPLIKSGIWLAASDKEPVFAAKLSNTAACVFISFNRVSISLSPTLTLPILSFSALGASPNAFSASLARPLISMLDGSALTLTLLSMALFKALFISSVNPSIFTLSMADLASSFAFEVALLLRESFWLAILSVAFLSISSNADFALLNFSETSLLCSSILLLCASTASDNLFILSIADWISVADSCNFFASLSNAEDAFFTAFNSVSLGSSKLLIPETLLFNFLIPAAILASFSV